MKILNDLFSVFGRTTVLVALVLFAVLLTSCSDGTPAGGQSAAGASTSDESGSGKSNAANLTENEAAKTSTRLITDYTKRTVEIPDEPKKIVYIGSAPGDLFVLGVRPVGASLGVISSQIVYPELLDGIEDIGGPEFNLEKIVALEPDLILIDGIVYGGEMQALGKIAPVVAYDSAAPMYERLRFLAAVTGKPAEAEKWITDYEAKAEAMLERLKTNPDDTATVLLQLGKELYVMGNHGLAVTIFDVLEFKPAPKVQEIIDDTERFISISNEVLPEYTGDWLFLLSNDADETVAATQALTGSAIWKTLPAVQNGQVYTFDSNWNFDDPITRERLLDELPRMMGK